LVLEYNVQRLRSSSIAGAAGEEQNEQQTITLLRATELQLLSLPAESPHRASAVCPSRFVPPFLCVWNPQSLHELQQRLRQAVDEDMAAISSIMHTWEVGNIHRRGIVAQLCEIKQAAPPDDHTYIYHIDTRQPSATTVPSHRICVRVRFFHFTRTPDKGGKILNTMAHLVQSDTRRPQEVRVFINKNAQLDDLYRAVATCQEHSWTAMHPVSPADGSVGPVRKVPQCFKLPIREPQQQTRAQPRPTTTKVSSGSSLLGGGASTSVAATTPVTMRYRELTAEDSLDSTPAAAPYSLQCATNSGQEKWKPDDAKAPRLDALGIVHGTLLYLEPVLT